MLGIQANGIYQKDIICMDIYLMESLVVEYRCKYA